MVLKECKSAMWQMKKLSMKSRSKETLYSNYLPKKATALAWASFRKISHDCFTNCALSFEYAFGVTTSLPGHAKNQNFSTKFIINLHTMVSKQPRILYYYFPLVIWAGWFPKNLWGEGLLLGITGPEVSWVLSVGDAISEIKFQVLETSTKPNDILFVMMLPNCQFFVTTCKNRNTLNNDTSFKVVLT